jgi:hypothetical protein
MFKLFERKQVEKNSVIGRKIELAHDITVYQYGTVFIDGVRYCAKVVDGSELCKGTMVEILEEHNDHGTAVLTVKKV